VSAGNESGDTPRPSGLASANAAIVSNRASRDEPRRILQKNEGGVAKTPERRMGDAP